jgi:4-amino-4-deoxy-L-arabinose transferase-like glycosyltransferase
MFLFLEKHRKIILICILFLGLILRFLAANATPIVFDEIDDFPCAKGHFLNFSSFNILVETDPMCTSPAPFKYLLNLGWSIFGESMLGSRLPFVIVSTCTILLVYLFVKFSLGATTALLTSFLLAINQFDIGASRTVSLDPPLVFFFILSLIVFYRGIVTSNNKLILLNGFIIGAGYCLKECMIFLIPIYIIFLTICPELRIWWKNRRRCETNLGSSDF